MNSDLTIFVTNCSTKQANSSNHVAVICHVEIEQNEKHAFDFFLINERNHHYQYKALNNSI